MEYIKLLRVYQYVKNLFIFLPLFFALKFTDISLLINTFWAFIAYSLAASGVYIFNDYIDQEEDRKHPKKKFRPIASGAVSPTNALILMSLLMATGLLLSFFINPNLMQLIIFYIVLNIAYSVKLKHIAILDVSIIAVGFVLRLYAGSFATGIELSIWIVLITFLLALFLALAKRRDDVLIFLKSGEKMRKSIDGYNLEFLNIAMTIMSTVVIVSYIMYTQSEEIILRVGPDLYITAFFVILGVLRYLQITLVKEESGNPTKVLLSDRFLQLIILGWISVFGWILYL